MQPVPGMFSTQDEGGGDEAKERNGHGKFHSTRRAIGRKL